MKGCLGLTSGLERSPGCQCKPAPRLPSPSGGEGSGVQEPELGWEPGFLPGPAPPPGEAGGAERPGAHGTAGPRDPQPGAWPLLPPHPGRRGCLPPAPHPPGETGAPGVVGPAQPEPDPLTPLRHEAWSLTPPSAGSCWRRWGSCWRRAACLGSARAPRHGCPCCPRPRRRGRCWRPWRTCTAPSCRPTPDRAGGEAVCPAECPPSTRHADEENRGTKASALCDVAQGSGAAKTWPRAAGGGGCGSGVRGIGRAGGAGGCRVGARGTGRADPGGVRAGVWVRREAGWDLGPGWVNRELGGGGGTGGAWALTLKGTCPLLGGRADSLLALTLPCLQLHLGGCWAPPQQLGAALRPFPPVSTTRVPWQGAGAAPAGGGAAASAPGKTAQSCPSHARGARIRLQPCQPPRQAEHRAWGQDKSLWPAPWRGAGHREQGLKNRPFNVRAGA
ncbi:uncharacterized protein LOC112548313 [Alligator sinensis]|uniref:Uncharacterized protein LOC112548313 n=1 Tax=Alligator sinensis TaxID=38654 RepID=A0A3Q0FQ88_ALLSI|nr:uncharacterized protein LOC112548313 [Alligator sinensis]